MQNRQSHQKADQWLPEAEEGERMGVIANGYRVLFWSDGNVLELDNGDNCMTPRMYKSHQIVYF